MNRRLRRLLLGAGLLCLCAGAQAHKPSDSYLTITGGDGQLAAQWDIALRDLELAVGLDGDANGEITWGEVKARRTALANYALARLQISADGNDCQPRLDRLLASAHSDGGYAALQLALDCPGDAGHIRVHYDLLFDLDPTHRGLVLYRNGAIARTHILGPEQPDIRFATTRAGPWTTLMEYIGEGVWHIWMGLDHVLFLLALLLPAVLVVRAGRWQAAPRFWPVCMTVLKIVTAFTVAHSITLWLAVMGYVSLPSRLVEATIALSIVVTALNNFRPLLPLSRWGIAFVFGLVHGFGFANVLLDLGLESSALALSLFGFNLGVELGQMVIVLALLPAAFLLRTTAFYRWIILRAGSALIALVATLWLLERALNLEIIGF